MDRAALPALLRTAVAVATLTVLLSVIGCSTKSGADEKAVGKLYDLPKAMPANLDRGHLRLLHQGHALYVGDDQSRIFEVFGPPSGATDVSGLPEGWDKDHYRTKGWEKGKDGFGVILVDDNVALAMFTSEGKSELELKAMLQDYSDILGEPDKTFVFDECSYDFWESNGQRLMISALNTKTEGYRVTQALGAVEIMDPLRMSVTAARADALKAHSLIAKPTP